MQPSEHFAPGFGRGTPGQLRRARYGVISNNGKTITVVTFGSVDAIGADEGSSGPLLALRFVCCANTKVVVIGVKLT